MKTYLILAIVSFLLVVAFICYGVKLNNEYSITVDAEWKLADKSSTIHAKREHLDKFVSNLQAQHLEGTHNALIFPNPNNSFDANFEALKTLQSRLQEIEGMDVKSFEYQTAIQQITAQEQGEAKDMLEVFYGCWLLHYHIFYWEYFSLLLFGVPMVLCALFIAVVLMSL